MYKVKIENKTIDIDGSITVEQLINDNLKTNFGINESELKQSTAHAIIATELKEKLRLLTEMMEERRDE